MSSRLTHKSAGRPAATPPRCWTGVGKTPSGAQATRPARRGTARKSAAIARDLPRVVTWKRIAMADEQAPERGSEVRAHPRFNVDWRVSLRCKDWGSVSRVAAENASRGGVFLLTSRPPAVGSEVELAIQLPDGTLAELRGRVQHVVTPERALAEKRSAGIGVKIDDRHAVDLLLLEQMAAAAETAEDELCHIDIPFDDLVAVPEPTAPQPSRPVGR